METARHGQANAFFLLSTDLSDRRTWTIKSYTALGRSMSNQPGASVPKAEKTKATTLQHRQGPRQGHQGHHVSANMLLTTPLDRWKREVNPTARPFDWKDIQSGPRPRVPGYLFSSIMRSTVDYSF